MLPFLLTVRAEGRAGARFGSSRVDHGNDKFSPVFGCWAGFDRGPAEGAGGVGMEPHVDALYVKAVAALGESATLFVLLEFGEANGAIGS